MIRRGKTQGFSLIELLVTLAILGVLAMAALPTVESTVRLQKERQLRLALHQIREAIDAYKRAFDEGRIQAQPGAGGYPDSLDRLVEGVIDQRDPKGARLRFLRKLPADPMAGDAAAKPADTWGKRSYASSADQPQEGPEVYDVYSRSLRTGLDGVRYDRW